MTCPITLLDASIGAMVAEYMVENPAVTVQLEATNRRVDVVSEGGYVAIRARTPPLEDSDLVMRTIAVCSWTMSASRTLVKDRKLPRLPAEPTDLPSQAIGSPQPAY